MEGLLNFAKTPEGQGLLSAAFSGMAAAGRGGPWNTAGAAGLGGLIGYNSAAKKEPDDQFSRLIAQYMTPSQGAEQEGMAKGAAVGDFGPTVTNAARTKQPSVTNIPDSLIYTGIANSRTSSAAKNLLDAKRSALQGIERKPNTFYMGLDGSVTYMPNVDKGITYDTTTGTVSPIRGYSDTMAGIEGKKTRAQEQERARFDLLTPAKDGVTQPISRLAVLGGARTAPTPRVGQGAGQQPNAGQPLFKTNAQLAADKKIAEAQAEATVDLPRGLEQANQTIAVLDRALRHPGLEAGTGLSSWLDPRNRIPGTDAYDFGVVMDQVKGKTFLQAYQSLKGGGQITEVEGAKAEQAQARLNTAQSEAEFRSALKDLRDIIVKGMGRLKAEAGVNSSVGAQAPSINDLLKKYGG